MASTTYDINVRYKLQDQATDKAKKLGNELDRTSKKASGLGSTLKGIAGAAALGFGFRAGKKWLIDYNSEMDAANSSTAPAPSAFSGVAELGLTVMIGKPWVIFDCTV